MRQEKIYNNSSEANCFFRSALVPPDLKIMIQVTERCNMQCKHCFLSATSEGCDLLYSDFRNKIIQQLINSNVKKVTLTGGEPLLHPFIIDIIRALYSANIETCLCTNGLLITENLLRELSTLRVHFNISLDGVSEYSYIPFRKLDNNTRQLDTILQNIMLVGSYGMLNGILTTPNKLIRKEEYLLICDFAIKSGAKYLLMNPLSPFGRGRYANNLALETDEMLAIQELLDNHMKNTHNNKSFELVYIRFPGRHHKKTASCPAGLIPYIFINGDVAICPYLVFAAENNDNQYSKSDFIIGNILSNNFNLINKINEYKELHSFCHYGSKENLGCAAMKISRNMSFDSFDMLG